VTSGSALPSASVRDLWAPDRRALTVGLVLTITLAAFEALAIATVMPTVEKDLGGLALYGWVFSGFFLASLLGIVVAGHLADRTGLTTPYAVGLGLFAVGLAMGGGATSMPMLVAARIAQGFGAGTIPATVYAAIGRGYPPAQRSRMFATISTAWVVPGLIGPAVATLIEHAASWRWVFLGLLPIVVVAAAMGVPALRALDRTAAVGGPNPPEPVDVQPDALAHGEASTNELAVKTQQGCANSQQVRCETESRPVVDRSSANPIGRAVLLVLGLGAVFGAGTGPPLLVAVALVAVGLPVAGWAVVGLVPVGTFRLAPGVPATVALRGILTWGFFAADAYVPLAVVDGRGAATWIAGAALTAGCITWTAGSWVQARALDRLGPRHLVRIGFVALLAGVVVMLAVALGLPVGLAVLAEAIGALGMGIAYSPLSVTVLAAAVPGEEGTASAGLQLSDALGIAVGTGIGGWIIATADHGNHAVSTSTAIVFAVSIVVALVGLAATARLPRQVPSTT
jgi:MFS family permease